MKEYLDGERSLQLIWHHEKISLQSSKSHLSAYMSMTGLLPSAQITNPKPLFLSKPLATHGCLTTINGLEFRSHSLPIRNKAGFSVKASLVTEIENSTVSAFKKVEKPIVVIDNYDSFTYNLCQYMGELGCNFEVYRNDDLTVEELASLKPRGILISPGPGTPQDSGISLETVFKLGPIMPVFGVCMGLQCIGEAFGGKVVRSPFGVVHGKSSKVFYDEKGDDGLFTGLPNPFVAGRYHSLVIERESFPSDELEITAWTDDGLVMAARHKTYKHLLGVQFHPESIITEEGRIIAANFVKLVEKFDAGSKKN